MKLKAQSSKLRNGPGLPGRDPEAAGKSDERLAALLLAHLEKNAAAQTEKIKKALAEWQAKPVKN